MWVEHEDVIGALGIDNKTRGLGNKKTSGDHPDSILKSAKILKRVLKS